MIKVIDRTVKYDGISGNELERDESVLEFDTKKDAQKHIDELAAKNAGSVKWLREEAFEVETQECGAFLDHRPDYFVRTVWIWD